MEFGIRDSTCYQKAGIAVFRAGLKNGVFTTVAGTRWRSASTVTSNSSAVPSANWGADTVASAISFLSTGDHVVVVARPTCVPFLKTGTATRDAVAESCGANPSRS